jgi:hypothetical protein
MRVDKLSSNVRGRKEIKGTKYTNLSTDEFAFEKDSAIVKKDDAISEPIFVIDNGNYKLIK